MCCVLVIVCCFFFFKQKTAYEMRISDWSSDVCSSDLFPALARLRSALKDDPDDIAAGVPEGAIEAGIDAWEDANRDMANYVSGERTDWDNGMIVAAIFKAVDRTILASPANHVEDSELLAVVFDSAERPASGVIPFPDRKLLVEGQQVHGHVDIDGCCSSNKKK